MVDEMRRKKCSGEIKSKSVRMNDMRRSISKNELNMRMIERRK
jgi:hypothetical protein